MKGKQHTSLWKRELNYHRQFYTSISQWGRHFFMFKYWSSTVLLIFQHLRRTIQETWWKGRVWCRTLHDVISWTNVIPFWAMRKCSNISVRNACSSASSWRGLRTNPILIEFTLYKCIYRKLFWYKCYNERKNKKPWMEINRWQQNNKINKKELRSCIFTEIACKGI